MEQKEQKVKPGSGGQRGDGAGSGVQPGGVLRRQHHFPFTRQQYGNTFQLPLLDSLFRAANVESFTLTARNDSLRVLSVKFRPSSIYSQYRLHYNRYTHLVDRIEYYTREVPGEEGHSGTGLISIRLYNYSFQPLRGDLFREDRFVEKSGGTFKANASYARFKLIDNTDK